MKIAASLCLMTAGAGLFAAAASAKQATVDGWKIMSGQSSAGGVYCTIQEDDESSHVGIQAMVDGQFVLAAMSKAWQWTVGQRYKSQWKVEGSTTWSGDALAVTPNVVILPVETYPSPLDGFGAGKSMTVTVAGAEEGYSLENFRKATAVLKRCLANKGEF